MNKSINNQGTCVDYDTDVRLSRAVFQNGKECHKLDPAELLALCKESALVTDRLMTEIPRLSDLVIADRPSLRGMLETLTATHEHIVKEQALRSLFNHTDVPEEEREWFAGRSRELRVVSTRVADLQVRGEGLMNSLGEIPSTIPLLDKQKGLEADLSARLIETRRAFWLRLYTVPWVREIALTDLRRVKNGEVTPATMIFTMRSDPRSKEQLRVQATHNIETIDGILSRAANRDSAGFGGMPALSASDREHIAKLLVETPLNPDRALLLLNAIKDFVVALNEVERSLVKRYGDVHSPAARLDREYQYYDNLCGSLGGDASEANAIAGKLEALTKPYLRLRTYFANANQRLVWSIATKFDRGGPISLEDLVQEGSIGNLRAVDKYDASTNYKYGTHATWWIRQTIMRHLSENSHTIDIPSHMFSELNRVRRASEKLLGQLCRQPRVDELASELGWPLKRVTMLYPYLRQAQSLESPPHGTGAEEGDMHGLLADKALPHVRDGAVDYERHRAMDAALSHLKPRERAVLEYRFGLTTGVPETLQEVARRLNLTRERVRQIESRAMDRLSSGPRAAGLLQFLDDEKLSS